MPSPANRPRLRSAGLLSAVVLLAGCTRDLAPPAAMVPVDTAFSAAGTAPLEPSWWESFGDPDLNQLVEQALAASPDLAAVEERFAAAAALAQRERAGLFPEVDAFLGGEARSGDGLSRDFLEAGLAARYELDLWGRIRARSEADVLRAEAARATYEEAAISLTAEVALSWYRLQARRKALQRIEAQIEVNENVTQSLINRFQSGEVRSVDVLRQEQLLEATRELKLIAESDLAVLRHQLQVLLGRSPLESLTDTAATLPQPSALPTTGLPADLLLRRPDLQSAYLELQAADRELAAAISDRFPRIDLTAGLRSSSEGTGNLFDDWIRQATGDLVGPLIDGGGRRAEVTRRKAILRQRMAEFTQASLVAYQEVEDALVRERKERERLRNIGRQLELQEAAFEQLQQSFFDGVGTYLDVLTSQTEAQQLEREQIESQRRLIEFRIALHRALAGPIATATNAKP